MVQFSPQGMTLQLWCKTSDDALLHVQATCLFLNLAICLRCMKKRNYNGTDTIPNSYKITMIRSAGAKFPPEYSDRNMIVKTQCVKQTWLSGSCRASPVVSISSSTQLTWLIQSALQQPLQHGTVVAVFLYVLLLLYLSLIFIPQKSVCYLTFPLDTCLRMSLLNSSNDSFIGIMGFRTVKF